MLHGQKDFGCARAVDFCVLPLIKAVYDSFASSQSRMPALISRMTPAS